MAVTPEHIPDEIDRSAMPLACYANYFEIGHNAYEFLLDAGQINGSTGRIALHSRLAIAPAHAKLLAGMLSSSITQYEGEHGAIPDILDDGSIDLSITNPRDFERRAIDARRMARGSDAAPSSPSPSSESTLPREVKP